MTFNLEQQVFQGYSMCVRNKHIIINKNHLAFLLFLFIVFSKIKLSCPDWREREREGES